MTDEKYLFEQTSRERKRNARGSFAKKGGSRSKRCSLPSDYLTAKERKELNGPVITYSNDIIVNEPITEERWRKLHPNVKKNFIKACFKQHHARLHDIAIMLGKADSNFRKELRSYNIDVDALARESKAFRKRKPSEEWMDFLKIPELPTITSWEEAVRLQKEEKEAQEASDAVKQAVDDVRTADEMLKIVSGSLNYIGDPAAAFQKAMLAIDPSKEYHFQIRFKEVTE